MKGPIHCHRCSWISTVFACSLCLALPCLAFAFLSFSPPVPILTIMTFCIILFLFPLSFGHYYLWPKRHHYQAKNKQTKKIRHLDCPIAQATGWIVPRQVPWESRYIVNNVVKDVMNNGGNKTETNSTFYKIVNFDVYPEYTNAAIVILLAHSSILTRQTKHRQSFR